jgi:hypothetical protein
MNFRSVQVTRYVARLLGYATDNTRRQPVNHSAILLVTPQGSNAWGCRAVLTATLYVNDGVHVTIRPELFIEQIDALDLDGDSV